MASQQLNLRLPSKLLADAKREAARHGYRNLQAFVEESVRARIYDPELTSTEWKKVNAALADVHAGRAIPGDAALAKMRRLASGKRYSSQK